MSLKAAVIGTQELADALDTLGDKVRKKGTKKAVNAGTKIVLKKAKSLVREKTGLLRKSLGRKTKVYRNSGVAIGIVGPRTKKFKTLLRVGVRGKSAGKEIYANPTQYAHLVDKGTKRSQAYPFMEESLSSTEAEVQEAMAEAMAQVIEDAIEEAEGDDDE